jgi:hypothetical protein
MANETITTVVGNLTADPELRFTPSGAAVANFTVAATPRMFDRQSGEWKDGDALFWEGPHERDQLHRRRQPDRRPRASLHLLRARQ